MKEVIVTGGRDYSNQDKVESVLRLFDISHLIQGGANGADALARKYAHDESNNIECITYYADWDKYDKAAGPIRNRLMLMKHPNAIVVAFPGGRGTANCVKQALDLGMLVLEVK